VSKLPWDQVKADALARFRVRGRHVAVSDQVSRFLGRPLKRPNTGRGVSDQNRTRFSGRGSVSESTLVSCPQVADNPAIVRRLVLRRTWSGALRSFNRKPGTRLRVACAFGGPNHAFACGFGLNEPLATACGKIPVERKTDPPRAGY
jgi:hypothetical protein